MADLGRILIIVGAALLLVGIALTFLPILGLGLGGLPGDIVIRRRNWTVYIPIVTSVVLSLVLTLIFLVISWLRR